MKVEFHIDGLPPTVNNYYIRTPNRVCRRAEAREWQEAAIAELAARWGKREAYRGAVELHIIFEVKTKRKWDIDNRIKPLQDCLEHAGVIANDSQVESLHVKRKYGKQVKTHIILEDYRQ